MEKGQSATELLLLLLLKLPLSSYSQTGCTLSGRKAAGVACFLGGGGQMLEGLNPVPSHYFYGLKLTAPLLYFSWFMLSGQDTKNPSVNSINRNYKNLILKSRS